MDSEVDQTEVRGNEDFSDLAIEAINADPDNPWKGIPHKQQGFIKDGTTMQVYISEDMAHRLKKAAAKLGVSRSEFVRVACRTFMEANGLWSLRGPKATKGNQQL